MEPQQQITNNAYGCFIYDIDNIEKYRFLCTCCASNKKDAVEKILNHLYNYYYGGSKNLSSEPNSEPESEPEPCDDDFEENVYPEPVPCDFDDDFEENVFANETRMEIKLRWMFYRHKIVLLKKNITKDKKNILIKSYVIQPRKRSHVFIKDVVYFNENSVDDDNLACHDDDNPSNIINDNAIDSNVFSYYAYRSFSKQLESGEYVYYTEHNFSDEPNIYEIAEF